MLTLRQIEVVRAIMVTGTIAGAAKMLNVSAPGISRLMKYTEGSLKVRLFDRRGGRYVPTPEARHIFWLLDTVFSKVEDLQAAVDGLGRGSDQELRLGSVPSISQAMVPSAIELLLKRFPELSLDINILKIEEAIDYLLLGKGEVVAISSRFDHSMIDFVPLATGRLVCIVPENSDLASRTMISPHEMAKHPLIGINPADPYGAIMADIFRKAGVDYEMKIKARFGTTVCSLVAAGLGIAIIDEFTISKGRMPGIRAIEIAAESQFSTYVAYRNDIPISIYAEAFIEELRDTMKRVATIT
ncbi:MAG: LysR family transcriptional regulator [Devosia sp.]|uniref:LysR family transcriptional regulator n=1 Tax=Devosia sp. TaxID=1871048 RepID=UPI0024CCAD81|nr:LysR family transcriptional regulator [Devosia sp.]UYO00279.1 MAG: LysR family transcriptional regulator [Devosia sp.]